MPHLTPATPSPALSRRPSSSLLPAHGFYFAMDAMPGNHPDPTPAPPPSLKDIREQVAHLEAMHRQRGLPLSGRIIHVCHHLPVEIKRMVNPNQEISHLTSPITPEFKPEGTSTTSESADAKWKIQSRQGHTAMVSGIRSLSESHEQLVVAWTGDIRIQPTGPPPTPHGVQPKLLLEEKDGVMELHPLKADTEQPSMIYNGELAAEGQAEITCELKRFSDLEASIEPNGKLNYVPVFLPPDVSKGHYEGYCKTTLWPLFHYLLWLDSTATVPSPDPSWIAYQKANELFADRVAEVYKPGDLIIIHDYHLLLTPKMIREKLAPPSLGGHWGSIITPSPAVEHKGMNWESGSDMSRLGSGTLGKVNKTLGGHLAAASAASAASAATAADSDKFHLHNEIMIALFIHTPWPSSEIFRALPSE